MKTLIFFILSFLALNNLSAVTYDTTICATSETLYLKASENLPLFAETRRNDDILNTVSHTRIRTLQPTWDTGFRLGVGVNLPCNRWHLCLLWMNYETDAKSHHTIPNLDTYTLLWGPFSPFSDSSRAKWNLCVNVIDLILSKKIPLSHCFQIRPYIGLRAASFHQKLHISSFTGGVLDQENRLKSNYKGIGPHIGLETTFKLCYGLSIYGSTSGSVLCGEFDNRFRNVDPILSSLEQKHRFQACQAIMDTTAGIRWVDTYCNFIVTLQLGYEQHFYFNQERFDDFGPSNFRSRRDDLCIQGLTFLARLDF